MDKDRKKIPPAVFSDDPQKSLEEELEQHPHDASVKIDVGSDESMDASDPPSAARSGDDEDELPASSGFPE